MKNKNTLQDQTVDELKASYRDLSKEIFQLKNEIALNRKIEKPHLLKAKKRERARVLTAVHQKGGVTQ
jgi:large subunit ribosomal protein L29